MEFELGQTYAGYKFLDVAQRSVSGVEYRVRNTPAERTELLKVLPPCVRANREETERFLREMPVLAELVHPNIVTFFTAMPLEGRLVMTTELVEGLPLSERLQLGPIPWPEAADFARQVLAAVDCAHQRQIVHRDISPANIIAIPGGVVKLTNFGLAKSIAGSLKYISPEQVKGAEAADHRSDLYSIGIVLYEMLAGRTPFNSASQFELMLAHVNQQPEPAGKFNSTVPSQLDAVLLKALAKFPSDRYQSAGEFDEALVRAVAGITPAEIVPAALPVTEVVAEAVADPEIAEAAPEPVAAAAEIEPAIEPEFVPVPIAAEAAPEPETAVVLAIAEAAPEPETAVVLAIAEALPEPVAVAAIEPEPEPVAELEPVAEPVIAQAPPEPLAAAADLAPVVEPEPVLLPETAVHASLWTAAEVVSLAAQSDLAPVFAESPPVPVEAAHPTPAVPDAAPVAAVLSQTAAPDALSPYGVPGFLAAAKARSESMQWAVFGGTAGFLGVIWVAIWLMTSK